MLYESCKAGRQNFRQALFAGVIEGAGQQQRTGVVIDAIAVRAIGHRVHGVLEQAGIIAHRQEMIYLHVWHGGALKFRQRPVGARDNLEPVALPSTS